MSEIFKVALSLSLSGTILIAVVWILVRLLGKRLTRHWQYYVWLVVVARLLIPYTPEISPIGQLFHGTHLLSQRQETTLATQTPENFEIPPHVQLTPSPAENASVVVSNWVQFVVQSLWFPWILVAFILLIRKITLYQSFGKYIRAGQTEINDPRILDLLGEICEQSGIRRPLELSCNGLISSPLLIGFRRPAIVLPQAAYEWNELQMILLHESAHYKKRDLFYKWLLQITLCLHWFNPLIHLMVREVNKACELSCDETVLRVLDESGRRQYGETLVKSLDAPGVYREGVAALTLSESAEQLKERLDSIMTYQKSTKWLAAFALVLSVCLFAGGFAIGAYSVKPDWINISNGGLTDEGLPVMSAKNRGLYNTYLAPVFITGLLSTNYTPEDVSSLLANHGNILQSVFASFHPEMIEEYFGAVPASLLEEALTAKLPLYQWMIRDAFQELYRGNTDSYELYGGLGGGPSVVIVTDSQQNGGLLAIQYTWYHMDDGAQYAPGARGEVVLKVDGDDFQYVSNQLSED